MLRKLPVWTILFAILIIGCTTTEAATPKRAADTPAKAPGPIAKAGDAKIKKLQQLLADTGFYPGEMNGILESTTKAATVQAQRRFRLVQTGKYDQKLIDILTQEARIKPNSYRKKLSMQATAYTSQDPGCGSLTKREHRLRRGLVAVDPKVIPLGTRLYIEGYGYAIADDIGSAIKGAKIDLAYENRTEAFKFGRKMVNVFVLD